MAPPLLYAYYGDDFTGSTDVLEALAAEGVASALFLSPDSLRHLQRFPGLQAIGVAGDSRSRAPEWMDARLPEIFGRLKAFGAPVTHYKVCSTFDSSPEHGSIGRAMDIGAAVFAPGFIPVVVGAPRLRRYVVFGNLFAAEGAEIHRIDRHPTMSRHPVTPMREADLRRHLAAQTPMQVGLVDVTALQGRLGEAVLERELAAGAGGVLFDGIDPQTLAEAGRLIWARAAQTPLFAVGSSGLTSALLAEWRRSGVIAAAPAPPAIAPAERLLVASGSCSPVTARQIERALADGFAGVAMDPHRLAEGEAADRYGAQALAALQAGRDVVLYSALGPLQSGAAPAGEALGRRLGAMLRELVERSGVRRLLLCGGDTSSHAVQQLGAYALTWAGPLAPGAPLCRAHAETPALDGLELVLKGGQIGEADFLSRVKAGG
jgi:uncharacterized protein YgbK (DUF1537 family)